MRVDRVCVPCNGLRTTGAFVFGFKFNCNANTKTLNNTHTNTKISIHYMFSLYNNCKFYYICLIKLTRMLNDKVFMVHRELRVKSSSELLTVFYKDYIIQSGH